MFLRILSFMTADPGLPEPNMVLAIISIQDTGVSLTNAIQYESHYIADTDLDDVVFYDSLLSVHRSDSLTLCFAMCGQNCNCLGYNSERKKCHLYKSCDSVSKTDKETGWRYYNSKLEEEGWLLYRTHYYLETKNSTTWPNARFECEKLGAHLVSIESEEENTWLTETILPAWDPGANDIDQEGRFVWTGNNRDVTSYSNWYPNEPDNTGEQDCVHLCRQGIWEDAGCDMYYFDSSDSDDTDKDYEDESDEKKGDIQDHCSVHNILAECKYFAGMKIKECYDGDKIKEGQRVVRGIDWSYGDQDGREGNIGTVIEVFKDAKQVRVQWDSSNDAGDQKDMYKYRTGLEGKYDLRLFDNSQTGVHHKFYGCDVCEETPIIGMRWRCLYCEDYDLCTECYMYDEHNIKHPFERHQGMKTMSDNVGIRANVDYLRGSGIFIGAHVKSRKGPKIEGRVIDMENSIPLYNCDAKVIWEDGPTKRCRVGRNGEVDIKFKVPAEVPYIEDHLQKITEDTAVVGLRVLKKTNDERSTVGTIIAIKKDAVKTDHKEKGQRPKQRKSGMFPRKYPGDDPQTEQTSNCVTVQWDDGEEECLETYAVEILLFDNSQIGIRHSAICRKCKSHKRRIKGIRWKCSKCPNYDLCSSCYMSVMDDHADHLFYRITDSTKGGKEGKTNRTKLEKPRTCSELKRKRAKGIFIGAQVQQLNDKTGRVGKVEELLHFKIKNYKCNVVVETKNSQFSFICVSSTEKLRVKLAYDVISFITARSSWL
ncbi:uncharacterized protein LOC134230510 [Saccostrea cucullata]|uniref:uncharacterized protein LOC134230510 n=1 Tax=Saccostrea cuccullata TaxID=36930 RepID=UPI002ED56803